MFHPDLLPKSADPQGSIRYENVNIVRIIIPCKEKDILVQFYKEDKLFIIYDCSPEYGNQAIESFKGTVLEEPNSNYSWWKSIEQGG
jgi:hypothetical protein